MNGEVSLFKESLAKRLGLVAFRISMLLSAIRKYEDQNIEERINCKTEDFQTAMQMAEVFLEHALFLYDHLPQRMHSFFQGKLEDMQDLYESLPLRFKRKDAIKIGRELGLSRSKVDRLLSSMIPKYWERVDGDYGYYKKV